MKRLFQKLMYVVLIAAFAIVASCKLQIKEEPNDPGEVALYSKPFKLRIKSNYASKLVLLQYPNGDKLYLDADGSKVKKYGLLMQLHSEAPDRKKDTLYATFNPLNSNLTTTWKIEDPSVLKLLTTAEKGTYIVVEALKLGKTNIIANVETLAADTLKATVSGRWCSELKILTKEGAQMSTAETIYRAVEDPLDNNRKNVTLNLEAKFIPELQNLPVIWDADKLGVLKITPSSDGMTCLIEPEPGTKEEAVTVTACCGLQTVTAIISVKNFYSRTPVESVAITEGTIVAGVKTLSLTTVQKSFIVHATAKPEGVMANYEFIWESSDPTVVAVAAVTGEPTAQDLQVKKAGTAIVRVKAGSDTKGWKKDSCKVVVTNAVQGMTLTNNKPTEIFPYETFTLTATLQDAAAHTEFSSAIRFESLTPTYASVNATTGVVTCLEETGLDGNGMPIKAKIKVTVNGWPLVSETYEFTIQKTIPALVNMTVYHAVYFNNLPGYENWIYLLGKATTTPADLPNPQIQVVLAGGGSANTDQTETQMVVKDVEERSFYVDEDGNKRDNFTSGTYTKTGKYFKVVLIDGDGKKVIAEGTVGEITLQ